jgi:hypothetical protein
VAGSPDGSQEKRRTDRQTITHRSVAVFAAWNMFVNDVYQVQFLGDSN